MNNIQLRVDLNGWTKRDHKMHMRGMVSVWDSRDGWLGCDGRIWFSGKRQAYNWLKRYGDKQTAYLIASRARPSKTINVDCVGFRPRPTNV